MATSAIPTPYTFTPTYQPNAGGNPMTNFLQSMENVFAGSGQQTNNTGQAGYGAGVQQAQSGAGDMAPALAYFTKLVSGDQADVNQAMSGQNSGLDQQFAAVRNLISQQPRGGGKASTLAEAPFQEAQTKYNAGNAAQANAATGLTQAAGTEANIGTTLAGLGLAESQQGLTAQEEAESSAIAQRTGNQQQQNSNLSLLTGGLSSLI